MHDKSREKAVHAVTPLVKLRVRRRDTCINAGVNFNSSWACNASTIEVIIAAAWNAIVREGYAASSG